LIEETFSDSELQDLSVCVADHFVNCGLENWRDCVAIARPPYKIDTNRDSEKSVYMCPLSQLRFVRGCGAVFETESDDKSGID
jgi:hypothetical protein